ncbi:carboxypeptidase-like regulatory domain-containing protein [Nostoc sp. FACHB-888]|uniref:carboxypeptidase-like regulatory domain-containing protein n=1 Tax=Nostoc sp. FACHB-888 TaxID=2692842 RepID=UPI00168734C2|nr:carboxypeptidase-like regulatory domain-containing protein [Nostoc sp. FACHB-888]MBD2247339.1 carboxypeptidase regulatory-like domain-containing protein [Nostoc sp. FACHB-888]
MPNFIGRIVDIKSQPIKDAKVSFEGLGTPFVTYTDTEGVFRFSIQIISGSVVNVNIRVEAEGCQPYNRYTDLLVNNTNIEEIRLIKRNNQQEFSSPIIIAIISAVGVIFAAFITAGLPFFKKPEPTLIIPRATTDSSLLPQSSATLKITQPSPKSKVSPLSDFSGTFENLSKKFRIELYVYASYENKYYCYTANRDSESDGHWNVNEVNIGGQGNNNSGANYNVYVLVLDLETNKRLQSCQGGSQVLTLPSNPIAKADIPVIRK